jgi:hypothetical protein
VLRQHPAAQRSRIAREPATEMESAPLPAAATPLLPLSPPSPPPPPTHPSIAVLSSPDLVGRILELACATPAHVGTAACVSRTWRAAAAGHARFHLTLTGRRDDWGTVAARLLRRLDGLTVCAANVQLGDVAALLGAQPALRTFTLSHCFGFTVPVARADPGRVAFFAALGRCAPTLRSLALCDVSQLAWPAHARLPGVTALSFANCALLVDVHGGADCDGTLSGLCSCLADVLRCFPSAGYVCLGGVALKSPVRARGTTDEAPPPPPPPPEGGELGNAAGADDVVADALPDGNAVGDDVSAADAAASRIAS